MKRILFLAIIIFSSDTYGNILPRPLQISGDGRIEIINKDVIGGTLAGYKFEGSDFLQLDIPQSAFGHANVISYDGNIIAGAISMAPREYRPVLWKSSDLDNGLPIYSYSELPLLDMCTSPIVTNISYNGRFVVGGCINSNIIYQACYWDENGDVHDLGNMIYQSSLFDKSLAISVSNQNIIVGTAVTHQGNLPQTAFIWDEVHGMRNLKDVLESEYGYNFGGNILSQAYNISPDSRTIDGYGYDTQGNYFEWNVMIPEPCTILLLGLGAMVLRKRK